MIHAKYKTHSWYIGNIFLSICQSFHSAIHHGSFSAGTAEQAVMKGLKLTATFSRNNYNAL